MSDWVFDCSMALAAGLPDERSDRAGRFLAQLTPEDQLWVPALWWYEMANALEMARRRGRLREADLSRFVSLCVRLPLMTDWLLGAEAIWRHRSLAGQHELTAYDSAYLELAQRRGIGLATLDKRLELAASGSGVTVLEH